MIKWKHKFKRCITIQRLLMKRFLKKATCSICMLGLLCSGAMANAEEYLIALDPGHGGDALGCVY